MVLPEFINGRLKLFSTQAPPAFQLWQHKSLNLHRGVIHWDVTSAACALPEIRDQIRGLVRDRFRPSWWRGFGFGAVVTLNHIDDSFQDAIDCIDIRNNGKGVWQWLVLHFPLSHSAIGIRTWTEGYLAPVYNDLLAALENTGVACENYQKDMDAFMKGLMKVRRKLRLAHMALGALDGLLP